uniref:NADH dehydrogenase [ubiquinone] iron-sulfur protein 5 n=1 Tax=Salvator merianae TaxID=96440 RepID=A0A8D0CCK6_SALMN
MAGSMFPSTPSGLLSFPFSPPSAMPFLKFQEMMGIDVDRWMLMHSSEQPRKRASTCHAFEKEWVECADGIGMTRAKQECKLEFEDLQECITRKKLMKRMMAITKQREKLIREGKYTLPDYHSGKTETTP